MFNKRKMDIDNLKTGEIDMEDFKIENYEKNNGDSVKQQKTNVLVKGSKLIGDININYDLELDGEVEGNITSEVKSNIVIKGNCKGSIKTKGGNVNIEGHMSSGDVIAGGDIRITGKFTGGKVEAKGKLYVDGEFSGKLESNEIEIGPNATGKGEIFYKDLISIVKGAKIEANITRIPGDQKDTKKSPQKIDDKKQVSPATVQQLLQAH